MTRALRIQLADSFYHITCRGNERKAIYRDDTDRQAFLTKLQDSLGIYQIELHVYVLMDNHSHLMVRRKKREEEKGTGNFFVERRTARVLEALRAENC